VEWSRGNAGSIEADELDAHAQDLALAPHFSQVSADWLPPCVPAHAVPEGGSTQCVRAPGYGGR